MKTLKMLYLICLVISASTISAQSNQSSQEDNIEMKAYLIERDIPGAGDLTPADLQGASKNSCNVLKAMDTNIEWVNSYVLDDKIYCIYKAQNESLIREHAEKAGLPCNKIMEISANIDPSTAEVNVNK